MIPQQLDVNLPESFSRCQSKFLEWFGDYLTNEGFDVDRVPKPASAGVRHLTPFWLYVRTAWQHMQMHDPPKHVAIRHVIGQFSN